MRRGIPVRTCTGSPFSFFWWPPGFQQYPATSFRRSATVMNVSISTFVRRGYLLTALAVAVLLAGFSSERHQAQPSSITVTLSYASCPRACWQRAQVGSASTPGRVPLTIGWSTELRHIILLLLLVTLLLILMKTDMRTASVFSYDRIPMLTNSQLLATARPSPASRMQPLIPAAFSVENKDGKPATG